MAEARINDTYSRSKGEFQVVGPKGTVVDRRVYRLIQEFGISKQILGHSQPQTK